MLFLWQREDLFVANMTPLERAARALWELDTASANPGVSFNPLHEQSDETKQRYAERVRAVLTAIRRPSEAMVEASESGWRSALGSVWSGQPDQKKHAAWEMYTAMIDAALAEGE
ncbi:hypothetical protein HY78_08610 [Rhizorhabdus wittichii DC-6]|nr:hypothetical protein HY78_08610 [Rhizorhabdus wittichii DC-6]